CQQYDDVPYNF
nr:immunoglobulin light chain junction region [Macaca mulatta]